MTTQTKADKKPFVPFPIGTVRGPFYSDDADEKNTNVQFFVLGHNGWLFWIRPIKDAKEAETLAREYSEKILAKLARQKDIKLPQSIAIIGRRWFRRSAGNTYCTAEIIIDGVTVHTTERTNGYGDYYTQAAFEWLKDNEIIPYPEESTECHWRYIRDILKINYSYRAIDVERQKDL